MLLVTYTVTALPAMPWLVKSISLEVYCLAQTCSR